MMHMHNHLDPSLHMRSFMDGAPYLCYDTRPQPYQTTPTTATIRLIPPLPESGTIMTGHSANQIQFSIGLKNRQIVYELRMNRTSTVLLTSQNVLSPDTSYQLDYTLTYNFTTISIGLISGDTLESSLETVSELITPTLSITDTQFQGVCLGGALLEDINYSGTLENVYFNHLSLTEERHFNLFRAASTSRSDVINFSGLSSPSSLQFTTRNVNLSRISFDVRTEPEDSGVLLFIEDNDVQFFFSIFNSELLTFLNPDMALVPCSFGINDGLWHHMDIDIIQGSTPGIRQTIDSAGECTFVDIDINVLRRLLDRPLQLGATDSSFGEFEPVSFEGCFQNIVFEYESGETFRPNLEAVARTEERFSTTGCFECSSEQVTMAACTNDGKCEYKSRVGAECLCTEDNVGPQCESKIYALTLLLCCNSTSYKSITVNIQCHVYSCTNLYCDYDGSYTRK